jgi:hypothetical protein
VFDTDVYVPRFELEYKENNMDQWVDECSRKINTQGSVCIFETPNTDTDNDNDTDTDNDNDNDNYNDIDLYSDKDEEKKPQTLIITADMRLFQSPVFHAPVATIISSKDRQTMPHLFQPCNAKEKSLFFKGHHFWIPW